MYYTCKVMADHRLHEWDCTLKLITSQNGLYEAIVEGRGSSFHLIAGPQINGMFLCIPNWDVGCELSDLSDIFWNSEQLRRHLNLFDTHTVAAGLSFIDEMVSINS